METPNSAPHVPPIRSTRGCWTCRLRKKKCGEERNPGCLRCASVEIECHYGTRPKWIDDSILGKEELQRIKGIVGASASRKRAVFRAKSRAASNLSRTEKSGPSPPELAIISTSDEKLPFDSQIPSNDTLDTVIESQGPSTQPKWVEDHEASLMMHYLDHVFFIQFRFYTPSISTGGRGWLLSLLTQTKPLYHAALSLSACLAQEGGEAQTDYLQELERHHNLTLKELQLFIQDYSENASRAFGGNVQILACIVQLISFELFHGGVSTWQVHLRAASELVLTIHGISAISSGTPPSQQTSSCQPPQFPQSRSFQDTPENVALQFFTGAIIWFDILACISTRSQPYLADYHNQLLSQSGAIELQTIMGCQNSIMIAIGEIGTLKMGKEDSSELGIFDIHQAAEAVREIQLRIEINSSQMNIELDVIRAKYSGPPPHHQLELYEKYTALVITQIFACAALIYLQTIVSSDRSVLHIQAILQSVMVAMRIIPDPRMFRGLVWPICVAGCMASSQGDQEFFRKTVQSAVMDSPRFGNSGQALQILEKSWEMQRERSRLIDCATALQELGVCVLLV